MDSSSNDSFAWTNASNDSVDSDRMAVGNIANDQYDEESESGKSYKKKLKKQLFQNNDQCTDETHVQSNETYKRRNIKQEDAHNTYVRGGPIKVEPDSEVEKSKKNKKSRHKETKECDDYRDSNDESFLNLQVKEEQLKSNDHAHTQHSNGCIRPDEVDSESSHSITIHKTKKKKKIKSKDPDSEEVINGSSLNNTNIELAQDCSSKKHKKKKKHKERSSLSANEDVVIEDKFSAEETVVGTVEVGTDRDSDSLCNFPIVTPKKKNKKSVSKHNHTDHIDDNQTQQISQRGILNIQTSSKNSEFDNTSNSIFNHANDPLLKSSYKTSNTSNLPETHSQRIPKISDRITFEDDNDSEIEASQNCVEQNVRSTKLKQFLQNNVKLSQVAPQLINDLLVTDEDDIWILKCPSEVNIEALQGSTLKLDSKCKIKVEGQTYEASVEETNSKVPIITAENGKFITKSTPVNGVINLRKRIPKAHLPEANIIVNNQTNFIPLPETKCRHPLFGLNYKKAIKIPSAVAQRLKQCDEQPMNGPGTDKIRTKSKKHKNHDKTRVDAHTEDTVTPCQPQPDAGAKNKRKRKHYEDHTVPAKKSKLSKHSLDSAGGWESEKAIEKNLFDF